MSHHDEYSGFDTARWRPAIICRSPGSLCLLASLLVVCSAANAAEPDDVRFFREKIEPVLKSQCFSCHSQSAKEVQGGLFLDSRAALLRGGETGPAVVPGKSADSLLVQTIRHENGLAMPPKKPKLADGMIADFVKWIDNGAADPRREETAVSDPSGVQAARKHWAFQPLQRVTPPGVHESAWLRSPIDAFVAAKLEAEQLTHAPPASRIELIRRVTFDLTGLPPEADDIDAFINDASPDA